MIYDSVHMPRCMMLIRTGHLVLRDAGEWDQEAEGGRRELWQPPLRQGLDRFEMRLFILAWFTSSLRGH